MKRLRSLNMMDRYATRYWFVSLIIFASCLLYGGMAYSQDGRNVFRPLILETPAEEGEELEIAGNRKPGPQVHPLLRKSVLSYALVGVVISPKKKMALIQTVGKEYFVYVGDELGNGEGRITEIDKYGLVVKQNNKSVSLKVRRSKVVAKDEKK